MRKREGAQMVRRGTRLSVASVLVLLSATADARIPGSHVPHAGVSRIQTRMGAEACAESPPAGVAKACSAATVLQHNWFDAANGVWANTAFWGSANGLSAVAALAATEGSGALLPAMRAVHSRHPGVVVLAEAGGSWDDAYWWVLAFLDAHAVLRDAQLVLDAAFVAEAVWRDGWDESVCGGGMWWSSAKSYKNAITNELAIDVCTRLYSATGNATWLDRANRAAQWFVSSSMINRDSNVADGLHNCTSKGPATGWNGWTYNQGVVLGNTTYLNIAVAIANATISHEITADGILREPKIVNRDGQLFKGIFARYLGQLVVMLRKDGKEGLLPTAAPFLSANAAAVLQRDVSPGGSFGSLWQGPVGTDACGSSPSPADPQHCVDATPQIAALNLLVAAAVAG